MAAAIDKAMSDQYPDKTPSEFQTRFQKEVRQSEHGRNTAIFDKRAIEAGFVILSPQLASRGAVPFDSKMVIHPEYKFCERGWRFDRAIPIVKLAIEIEGGIWRRGGGAHSHPTNIMRDIEKYNAATLMGWRILRFSDYHLKSPYVIECLQIALKGG